MSGVDTLARALALKAVSAPIGTAATYSVTPNGATTQTLLSWQPATEANNTEGYQDRPEFAIKVARYGFATPDSYKDNVFCVGWNSSSVFTPADANHPCTTFRIESKFKFTGTPGAITQAEIHLAHWTKGANSQEMRPFSIGAPDTYADWVTKSSIVFAACSYNFGPGDNTSGNFLTITCNAATRRFEFTNMAMRQSANNLPWLQQMNAAASAVKNLPYVDANDHQYCSLPVIRQITSPPNSALIALQIYDAIQGLGTASTGLTPIYRTWPAVTGYVQPYFLQGSASSYAEARQENSHASGKNGITLQANGIQFVNFYDPTNTRYTGMSYRPADGTLRIGGQYQGSAQGGGDAMVIAYATAQVTFLYPPKHPLYTVAGLPSAATAGASAKAHASNGRKSGEGAAAGTGVPVWSDGTNWRTFYDNSIAAA